MMNQERYSASWESLDARPIPAWFGAAKFGIFIHWGVYSVPAYRAINNALYGSYAEWYYASVYGAYRNSGDRFHEKHYGSDCAYRDFAARFTTELFDAGEWADLFQAAGARYVVLTAKHHDGYCLWPTDNPHKQDWNAATTGPQRDLLGELTSAVRDRGLKMGVYYSMVDWETNRSERVDNGFFIPEADAKKYGIGEARYPDEILLPQLTELVEKYQPAVIFSDGGEWDFSEEYAQVKPFLAWLYNHAPNKDEVVVNDRFCKGMPGQHGDYFSSEYQDVAGFGERHPWEENRGIGKSYGFNRAENLADYLSADELILKMAEMVSAGGNFLLNVGPTAWGKIPVIQEERLREIGDWLRINGEAIYDSEAGRRIGAPSLDDTYVTQRADRAWIISSHWPEQALHFTLNDGARVKSCRLLTAQGKPELAWSQQGERLTLSPMAYLPSWQLRHAYVYEVEFY